MNNITYLSVINTTDTISYAIFKGTKLITYKQTVFYERSHYINLFNYLNELIIKHKIDIIITNKIDLLSTLKKNIVDITEKHTIIKLCAEQNNILYSTFSTYGWERRVLAGNTTNKNKINFINAVYNIQLKDNEVDVANAIILAEGVAHNRLQVGGN